MAKKSYSFPTPSNPGTIGQLGNWSSRITTTGLACQICGIRAAGPGGMCGSCAGGVTGNGALGNQCGQCGTLYHTSDVACPACMVKMMQQAITAKMAYNPMPGGGRVPREPVQPEPLPRADMQVVDLVGWRVWRITSLGYLRSLTADAIWLPGVPMEAPSVVDSHGQGSGADYGVHVFKERHGAVLEVEQYLHNGRETNPSYAIGSVLLWGDVVEHERGYRAERAKILSIDDVTWKGKPPWDKETAEVLGFLRRRYGVEPQDD